MKRTIFHLCSFMLPLLCVTVGYNGPAYAADNRQSVAIVSDGKRYNVSDCNITTEKQDGITNYIIEKNNKAPLLEEILLLTVSEVSKGEAVVSGLTKDGINSNWGSAALHGNCWDGEDFSICFDAKSDSAAFTAEERKKMGIFLSNFTELGMFDFKASDILNPSDPGDMIRFGIWHNYINNFKSTVKRCNKKDCSWGSLTMDGKFVRSSLQRYFNYNLAKFPSVENSDPPYHYDGKQYHFEGADGEAVYYANVEKAERQKNGLIKMSGYLYNTEDKEDRLGTFVAFARPHTWQGKNTWAIESIKTTYKD